MASQDLTTRCGISPDVSELPYSIRTSDVTNYIQKKIDTVLARKAAQTKTQPETINIEVNSSDMSKFYAPFIVLLPLNALDDSGNKKRKKMPSIFDTKSDDGTATLKKEIYDVLSTYTYNKNDVHLFKSDVWRREVRVSREGANNLISMRTPKIVTWNHGRDKSIKIALDPLKVFHDMLKIPGDNNPFFIRVPSIQKIGANQCKYNIIRETNKSKKNKKNMGGAMDQINSMLKGNNYRRHD